MNVSAFKLFSYKFVCHNCTIVQVIYGVGIITRPQAGQQRNRHSIFDMDKRLFLLRSIRTGSRIHPAFCSLCTRAVSLEVERPWREADISTPSSVEVKNEWGYASTYPLSFTACVPTGLPRTCTIYYSSCT